ncbi:MULTISPECIES: aminoacyl-tRNA deacylase [unclassified Paenibacillus]|uniref:aminoacyl-tRNA deacylase n=1 Tax=unclassified Paenibacillus TaxID=185978 RepID=UPI0002DA6032|nr:MULTISPECIES: YbaK/EbsC family protein [unclassified Paenibacillus]MCM3342170.1 YbaK/EbsC family protein [Paenibacillus sp. MER TA 81-3]
MYKFEQKMNEFIAANQLKAEHLVLEQSCHSVKDAAIAVNGSEDQFVKNICMIDNAGRLIVAIVHGKDRASTSRVSKALDIDRPRLAEEAEVLERTGYPAGGVPSFGYDALFLIDPKVTELECIYTGGGSPNSLVRIEVEEMLNMNAGKIARIRK